MTSVSESGSRHVFGAIIAMATRSAATTYAVATTGSAADEPPHDAAGGDAGITTSAVLSPTEPAPDREQ